MLVLGRFGNAKGRGIVASLLSIAVLGRGTDAPKPANVSTRPEDLYDSTRCWGCHTDHYEEWASSMHAYAARDPVFLAMNRRAQVETDGALGSLCVGCHAPMALGAEAVNGDHNNPLRLTGDTTLRGRSADHLGGGP